MAFSIKTLHSRLLSMPPVQRYVIGLSGGMDSICLTHAMAHLKSCGKISSQLLALHINHGLDSQADYWQRFCEEFCRNSGIAFMSRQVCISMQGSQEAAAREARYSIFDEVLETGDMLLLAHQLDDQLETFLLRLMRGAGSQGLSGMPVLRSLGQAILFRPMLSFTRDEIAEYAQEQNLQWVEDGSNLETRHDRNYLRHRVLPLIAQRWPDYQLSWSKSLQLLDEAGAGLSALAEADLKQVSAGKEKLILKKLAHLSQPRVRNLVQYWISLFGLPRPGWHMLLHLQKNIADPEQNQVLHESQEYRLVVFNACLWLLKPLLPFDSQSTVQILSATTATEKIRLPDNGMLTIKRGLGEGIRESYIKEGTIIRYRQGGEVIKLPGRPHKSLKKLFQEQRVPPWVRERLPLVFVENELVCVTGMGIPGIAESAFSQHDEFGVSLEWQQPSFYFTG